MIEILSVSSIVSLSVSSIVSLSLSLSLCFKCSFSLSLSLSVSSIVPKRMKQECLFVRVVFSCLSSVKQTLPILVLDSDAAVFVDTDHSLLSILILINPSHLVC